MTEEREAELLALLRAAALEAEQRELPDVARSTRLDTLELDSLSFMQVVAYFEDALGKRLPSQRFARAHTVGDFLDIVDG